MRILVMFDLPTLTSEDRKEYRNFRKYLIVSGFLMLQESVYSKIVLNSQQSELALQKLRKKSPGKGLIQVLTITEKQYSQIEYIIGDKNTKIIDSEDRLVVL